MSGKKILYVEDNEDNRIVYSTILRHFGATTLGTYGYSIDVATGALTAVAGSPFAVGAMSPALMAIAN